MNDKREQAMLDAHQLGRSDYRASKPMAPPAGLYAQERVSYCAGWLGEKTRAMGRALPPTVNNYKCGIYQNGEVFIETEPRQLEANLGRVYLTIVELRKLLELAEASYEL